MSLSLASQIESILFVKTEPVSVGWLAKFLDVQEEKIEEAITELRNASHDRGVAFLYERGTIAMTTHPDTAELVERLHAREVKGELSKSALETLAIILYKGSTTKADIDYIRGVNSQFMLRNLLVRGLISKESNPDDKRRALYVPTHDTLAYLGILDTSSLPQYTEYVASLDELLSGKEKEKDIDAISNDSMFAEGDAE